MYVYVHSMCMVRAVRTLPYALTLLFVIQVDIICTMCIMRLRAKDVSFCSVQLRVGVRIALNLEHL